jgi:Flp pilus assembly protein TadG
VRVGRQSGQNTVELAFGITLMLMVALGLLDFGRVFYTYVGLTNAARVGAREATRQAEEAVPICNMTEIKNKVKNEQAGLFLNPLNGGAIDPSIITLQEGTAGGCPVPAPDPKKRTVAITNNPFQPFSFYVANWMGGCPTPTGPLVTSTCGTIPLSTWATLPVMTQ